MENNERLTINLIDGLKRTGLAFLLVGLINLPNFRNVLAQEAGNTIIPPISSSLVVSGMIPQEGQVKARVAIQVGESPKEGSTGKTDFKLNCGIWRTTDNHVARPLTGGGEIKFKSDDLKPGVNIKTLDVGSMEKPSKDTDFLWCKLTESRTQVEIAQGQSAKLQEESRVILPLVTK